MSDKYPDNPAAGDIVWTSRPDGTVVKQAWDGEKWDLTVVTPTETAVYTANVIASNPHGVINTQQAINENYNDRLVVLEPLESQVKTIVAAQANLTQNLEQAQGTKSRGIWQHHSGPLSDEGKPDENRFWMADEDGNKTQDFCEVKTVRISNTGLGDGGVGDNVYLGKAEIDDQLLIQNQKSLDGCSYVITAVEDKENYAIYGVEPDNTFCRGGVAPGEHCVVKLKKPVGTFELADDTYLKLVGGTANKMQGTLYMGGHKICGVTAPERSDDAATRGFVEEQIAAIPAPEGGGFITEYDGNRYYKRGTADTALEEGDVMFLSGDEVTETFAAVTHVALPEVGIDWDKFTYTGSIEVRNGGTVCGYLQVISAQHNEGKNWLVKVKMIDIESNAIEPESGHPCYFRGMFFG